MGDAARRGLLARLRRAAGRRRAHRRLDRPARLYAPGAGLPVAPRRRSGGRAGQRAGGQQAHRARRLARARRGDASRRRRRRRRWRPTQRNAGRPPRNPRRRSAATRRCSTATPPSPSRMRTATTAYPIAIIEDRPPTIARGPLTVNRSGSFTLAFDVTDDYGVTEGSVTFRPAEPPAEGARPLVEAPPLPLRIDRSQARDGHGARRRAAGGASLCRARSAAGRGREGRRRPGGAARRYRRDDAAGAALLQSARARADRAAAQSWRSTPTAAPNVAHGARRADHRARAASSDSGIYLGLRVGYHRLVNARNDDDLREVLDYLWADGARHRGRRAVGRRAAARAPRARRWSRRSKDGASRGGDRAPDGRAPPGDAGVPAELHGRDGGARPAEHAADAVRPGHADAVATRICRRCSTASRSWRELGDREAAQELLSQLQQMLDNLQMAQPGQMSPMDQQTMRADGRARRA